MADAPRDSNRVPSLIGKSDANNTSVVIEADPVTKRLKVTSTVSNLGKLITETYDYISITPDTSRPTSVVYKTGGSGGATVATLTIAYNGSTNDITSVTKT